MKMHKENSYAEMEKLGAQICRCTRLGLKVMPWGAQATPGDLDIMKGAGLNLARRGIDNITSAFLFQESFSYAFYIIFSIVVTYANAIYRSISFGIPACLLLLY